MVRILTCPEMCLAGHATRFFRGAPAFCKSLISNHSALLTSPETSSRQLFGSEPRATSTDYQHITATALSPTRFRLPTHEKISPEMPTVSVIHKKNSGRLCACLPESDIVEEAPFSGLLLTALVALVELVHAACGVDELHLSGIERMGGVGNLDLYEGVGHALDVDALVLTQERVMNTCSLDISLKATRR